MKHSKKGLPGNMWRKKQPDPTEKQPAALRLRCQGGAAKCVVALAAVGHAAAPAGGALAGDGWRYEAGR